MVGRRMPITTWTTSPGREQPLMIPRGLRIAFIVHFAVDMIVGIPLFLFPSFLLGAIGWESIDPIFVRLFAAALLGIGLESLLGYNAEAKVYQAMLNLKIVWSLSAAAGIALSLIYHPTYRIIWVWIGLAVFLGFNLLWLYWRLLLYHMTR